MAHDDVFEFQACRTVTGEGVTIDLYRHNGRRAGTFARACHDPISREATPSVQRFPGLFANLTETEQRTWLKLLGSQSIATIAKAEGVSRTAIYERIRGHAKRPGGMVAKNAWVAQWWRARQVMTHR